MAGEVLSKERLDEIRAIKGELRCADRMRGAFAIADLLADRDIYRQRAEAAEREVELLSNGLRRICAYNSRAVTSEATGIPVADLTRLNIAADAKEGGT